MQPYPHRYSVEATGTDSGSVELSADRLPKLSTAPPAEFGGPGDHWSPESLLVAAAADCFILTFRAVAQASKLDWTNLRCSAEGTLDRVDRVTRFVAMKIDARLTLPSGGDAAKATRLLEKSEKSCLITNSLNLEVELETTVNSGA